MDEKEIRDIVATFLALVRERSDQSFEAQIIVAAIPELAANISSHGMSAQGGEFAFLLAQDIAKFRHDLRVSVERLEAGTVDA